MEKKYDVFISCKSEDYGYAEEVYNFLNSNGIHTFLASKELRKMGDSEYRNAIMQALESAYHLIIFASNPEYIESKWVFYEWDTFVNAKLNGRKDGQIMTILKGFNISKLRLDLIKYESFTFEKYKDRLLPYVETPESQRVNVEQKSKHEAEIFVETDLDCHVKRFHRDLIIAHVGKENVIHLPQGRHKLQFVAIADKSINTELLYEVKDVNFSDFIEIKLLGAVNESKEQECRNAETKHQTKEKKLNNDTIVLNNCTDNLNKKQETQTFASNQPLPNGLILNNKYYIQSVISQGGFGIVYKAISMDTKSTFAIKEFFLKDFFVRENFNLTHIRTDLSSEYLQMFKTEAVIMSSLNHPNFVKIFDVFEQNNTSYYVMEYITGDNLYQLKQKEEITQMQIIQTLKTIALSLEYIHRRNIVHGDIAPQNILYEKQTRTIKIVDFGLALVDKGAETTIPMPAIRRGYSPLERYRNTSVIKKESDVYSFGALAYYLLTGKNPPDASDLIFDASLITKEMSVHDINPTLKKIVLGTMCARMNERMSISDVINCLNDL